jgi:hypothetical protein
MNSEDMKILARRFKILWKINCKQKLKFLKNAKVVTFKNTFSKFFAGSIGW